MSLAEDRMRVLLAPASTHSDFTARATHQGAAQSHESR
jgi:hypothetical protein